MKKILSIIIFFIFLISPVFAKSRSDNSPQDFTELGRYVGTFEINDEIEPKQIKEEDNFEDKAIYDITKIYEKNAVELKLSDINDKALDDINNSGIFELKVNETQFKIENDIKNENMIWDSSKHFAFNYRNLSRQHLNPIPSIINSSKLEVGVSDSLSAQLGQANLYDANGPSVLFIKANESIYNTGSVVSYRGNHLNLSTGTFSKSYNQTLSGGAVLSSNPLFLPKKSGSIVLGSAFFKNENQQNDKTTGGGFIEYSYGRLKLNAQVGQSRYSHSSEAYTSLYLAPEFQISDSIFLKTRFIRNLTDETTQDELALTFKPKNNKNNIEFEINTSKHYTNTSNINQRIKFTTSFKF